VSKPEPPTALDPIDPARRAHELERLIEATVGLVHELLAGENELPGAERRDPEHLSRTLDLTPPPDGLEIDEVIDRLREVLLATPSSSSWRFLNQLFGGREPVAAAAETLAVVSNVSMYTFASYCAAWP